MSIAYLEKLASLALEQGLDALALMPGPNLFHLTGLSFFVSERPILMLIPVDADPAVVLPELEAGKAEQAGIQAFPYTDEEGYALAFHEACAHLELAEARIGVEALRMRVLEARILQRYAPDVILSPADDLFAELRMIKDVSGLDAMRRAIAVAENAFLDWLTFIHVGVTEQEAAGRLVAALFAGGAERLAFDPIVCGGPNGALPHAVPGPRHFRSGDWVVVDWGAVVSGYHSDLTRMVVFGEPRGELLNVYDLVLRANKAGRAAVAPGAPVQAVDAAARVVIDDGGYGAQFIHRTGHGLGLEAHEAPSVVSGNTLSLSPGMTFTVEPGVYLAGVGGVRIEDDVLVTQHGSETLTSLSREPFIVSEV